MDETQGTVSNQETPIATKNLFIKQFHQNQHGIWIVSDDGLFLMDTKKETILKHYTTKDGFPFDKFNHIHEDKAGIFWLGTIGGGLIRWVIHQNN